MTAIKTTERGATGTSSISSGHQEARIERTILVATNDFTSAVSNGVAELMRRCGFSRERATALLLRELRRGDSLPSDNQIFELMNVYHLGMEDGSKAIIVSKAINRAKTERSLSPVDAIDELTLQLSFVELLKLDALEEAKDDLSIAPTRTNVAIATVRLASKKSKPFQKATKQKLLQKKKDTVGKSPMKVQSRKRLLTAETSETSFDETEAEGFPTGRARSDSVSEVVKSKISKIASENAPSSVQALSQIIVRGSSKRSFTSDEPVSPTAATPTSVQQAIKRSRSDA